jgi:hypothetical protein
MRMLAKTRPERPTDGGAARIAIDALGAATSLATPIRPTVRAREQRVVSILLASKSSDGAASVDATLGSAGGMLGLADGSTMVVISGPESPGDLAARAVRYALALRSTEGAVAIATGRALLSGPTPMGEVIDRAAALVADAVGKVRADGETAALVEGRFELATDHKSTYVVAVISIACARCSASRRAVSAATASCPRSSSTSRSASPSR